MGEERGGPGGGKVYEYVMATLRDRLADGTYALNSPLPNERDLSEQLGVSRATLRRVLRDLKNEGWIESRQGSHNWVIKVEEPIRSPKARDRPDHQANLTELMVEAFSQPDVVLDVFSLTAESLARQVDRLDDRIRGGEQQAPRRIALRLMLPSDDLDMPYPRTVDPADPDREALRERHLGIAAQKPASIRKTLLDLMAEGLIETVEIDILHVPLVPTFKLYLLNGTEALWGPYNVVQRPIHLEEKGRTVAAVDVLGVGGPLMHFVTDDEENTQAAAFVALQQSWFDSVWKQYGGH